MPTTYEARTLREQESGAVGSEIVINGVVKEYPRNGGITRALSNTSYTVQPGSFVSILGKSGCGKSTLLSMIAGLVEPTHGTITIDGEVVRGPRSDVGVVFQRDSVFPWRRVRANVTFGLDMKRKEPRRSRRERANELLAAVGLEDYADAFPKDLSGGMRQRVAIAQALICEPRVLLMDEPLGALDALTRENMQDLVLGLWGTRKMTTCFVTHDIEEAVYLSDTVLVIDTGETGIRAAHDVPFTRPRGIHTREAPEFSRLCGVIRREIY
jgi:NitT/TauT family transport system ATP-binding protein